MVDWHPILAAREVSPGTWWMLDGLDKPYGTVGFVKRGDQVGYRAERCSETGEVTALVGYFTSLRGAAWAIHSQFVRSHGAPASREYGR